MTAPLTCSAAAADLPLAGTAAEADGWLCVEQPGAWGRDVLADAVLGETVTSWLVQHAKAARVRPMLIRQHGRAETGRPGPDGAPRRTVLLASVRPGQEWCERIELSSINDLTRLDLSVVRGHAPGLGAAVTAPVLLVCTHGKRDQCCARLGRPLANALTAQFPGQVWECSHTGGHRFAPSVVALPTGLTYGRVTGTDGAAILTALRAGTVYLPGLRGRSGHAPVCQAAEVAVRQHTSVGVNGLVITADGSVATVTERGGKAWRVHTQTVTRSARPASCGAIAKPAKVIEVTSVQLIHTPATAHQ